MSIFKQINGRPMTAEETAAYLERIDMPQPEKLDEAYLARLQWAHMQAVPFENLDIMRGRELTLDRDPLFEKIVYRRRGGVCAELNTLYNWLLESLGYDVDSYHSRIISDNVPYPGRSHRIMAVNIEGQKWLTDVGFNYEHHRKPLLLEAGLLQDDGECGYRLERDPAYGWLMWQDRREAGWRKKIAFSEDPNIDADFVAATFFAQHHRDSKINKKTKVSLYIGGVFHGIRQGNYLVEHSGVEQIVEEGISSAREEELLREVFKL
ncbi:MAG: arylamine N-acetyltransferase family protein [Anaerovoracaceae bacterium]|jgi:arylamine N-acetyltransferase